MRTHRLHWDAEVGWIIDVHTTIAHHQIDRIAKWAIPHQVQRYTALPNGGKKDELGRAIDLLKKSKITQRLIDHDNDGVIIPFCSTEKSTTRSYFHG